MAGEAAIEGLVPGRVAPGLRVGARCGGRREGRERRQAADGVLMDEKNLNMPLCLTAARGWRRWLEAVVDFEFI